MRRYAPCLLLLAALSFPAARSAFPADRKIPIMVDGLPLDAKAIVVQDEVYVPAWILENYARTQVLWMRQHHLLEIFTGPEFPAAAPGAGTLRLKIGFYLTAEGFVVGRNTRLFLLNADPKEFQFPDGKSPADRAVEGAIKGMGPASAPFLEYLALPPAERQLPKGWELVARMHKEEVKTLSASVDRYELLYRGLFFDLVTNLVSEMEQLLNGSSVIEDSLKGLRIDIIDVRGDGSASIRLPNGLYFLYARMLHGKRQVIWDIPVVMRGGETLLELSNRNAAFVQ